jgi:uncharacterized protein (TIGR02453 family)
MGKVNVKKKAPRSAPREVKRTAQRTAPKSSTGPGPHFTPELFRFLRDLAANNNRAWFEANRTRYEEHVKEPLISFIIDFAPRLRTITRSLVADPRPVGGSMFRIYRDTRFAKDKSPYKTMASAQFRHRVGKDVHAPGFYLHLEPGQVFVGAGLWHPEPSAAAKIRAAIAEKSKEWARIKNEKKFRERCELAGESLARPPRGFDPEHPFIEDLKRKDFIVVTNLSEKHATRSDFLDEVTESFRAAAPFTRFVTEAVDLEW